MNGEILEKYFNILDQLFVCLVVFLFTLMDYNVIFPYFFTVSIVLILGKILRVFTQNHFIK